MTEFGFGSDPVSTKSLKLHIGTHKTGTTSFQAALHAKADDLGQQGVRVFRSELTETRGWAHELPLICVRPELTFPLRCKLPDSSLRAAKYRMREHVEEQIASSNPILVASHEALSFIRSSAEVECLAELISGRVIQVILTLRDKEAFMLAWRGQLKRMGYGTSSLFRDSFMNTESNSWLTNWDQLIKAFVDVLGSNAVTVLNYEKCTSQYGSIVQALWKSAELPSHLAPTTEDFWLNSYPRPQIPKGPET